MVVVVVFFLGGGFACLKNVGWIVICHYAGLVSGDFVLNSSDVRTSRDLEPPVGL